MKQYRKTGGAGSRRKGFTAQGLPFGPGSNRFLGGRPYGGPGLRFSTALKAREKD